MKIRLAEEDDINVLAEFWSRLPNASLYGNRRLLFDVLGSLFGRGVMVVAEDGDIVGSMALAPSNKIDALFNPFKEPDAMLRAAKAFLGLYGNPAKLLINFLRSRKAVRLTENSFHGLFVYVEPDYRGKGISLKMWNLAQSRISGKVTLLIDEGNKPSVSWARTTGFSKEAEARVGDKTFALYSKETE